MSNINELKPTINLNPFARFCCTIGNLPSSYMASLTYEEQLMWLCDYLKNTVIPTVNNNAECVKELQELYVELKNYVDNYFENLDVQNEINKKLDEMAESGVLQQLIEHYFNEVTNSINNLEIKTQNTLNLQDNKINNLIGSIPIFVENIDLMTQPDKIYVLTSNNHIYQYNSILQNFVDTGAIFSENQDTITIYPTLIRSGNYENLLPDLNNINQNIIYQLLFEKNSETVSLNLPESPDGLINTLICQFTNNYLSYQQIYITGKGKIYKRFFLNNRWYKWETYKDNLEIKTLVNKNNYLEVLPDINEIDENSTFNLLFSSNSSDYPLNLPEPPADRITTLITFVTNIDRKYSTVIPNSKTQIYFTYTGSLYYRFYYNNKWYDWINISKNNETSNLIINVGTNQQYTKLKDAIEYATQFNNSIINILDGTYDLIEEFGNEFFENYTSTSSVGLILKNNVKLIFSANSKVLCNYTGTNEIIKRRFSPFNTGINGCTIENMTLESSGVRYGIHDERGQSTENYINNFINCNIKHTANGGLVPCIGGGLGKNGIINIKNCIFNSTEASETFKAVSYHNNFSSTDYSSKSLININNCYFVKGTFYLTWCGVSTIKTTALFSNNRIQSPPQVLAERDGIDNINNVELFSFNNFIDNT